MDKPLLNELLPLFAKQLESALRADGDVDLADQVPKLRIWGQCGCGDDFCASFYTGPAPNGAWADEGDADSVPAAAEGVIALDIVDARIRYVEVHDNDQVKAALKAFRVAPSLAKPTVGCRVRGPEAPNLGVISYATSFRSLP